MPDNLDPMLVNEQQVVNHAAALLRQGARGRDQAATLLIGRLTIRITRYMMRHRVPEAEAEELVTDVIMKFITSEPTGVQENSALALFWTICDRVLIDWARRKATGMRGGGIEGTLDEETWLILLETSSEGPGLPGWGNAGRDLAAWVKECVHRAAALFQHDKPRQAHVLLLYAQGYSHRELAVILGANPDTVTPHQEKAAKARVHHACKLARDYFEECKE